MYTVKNVGASVDPCGTPFLIVLVLLRSPPRSIAKFLGEVMRFSNFLVFLHLIILISLSISHRAIGSRQIKENGACF